MVKNKIEFLADEIAVSETDQSFLEEEEYCEEAIDSSDFSLVENEENLDDFSNNGLDLSQVKTFVSDRQYVITEFLSSVVSMI